MNLDEACAHMQPHYDSLIIKDAEIDQLLSENKTLLNMLGLAVECLEIYAKQHGGVLAQTVLIRLQGGH